MSSLLKRELFVGDLRIDPSTQEIATGASALAMTRLNRKYSQQAA